MLILISCYKSEFRCTAGSNPCDTPVTIAQGSLSTANAIKPLCIFYPICSPRKDTTLTETEF